MSIIRCEEHGNWDSDFHEECPRCEIAVEFWRDKCERITKELAEARAQIRKSQDGNWILMPVDPPPEMIEIGSNVSMEISANQVFHAYEAMVEWCADKNPDGVIGTREREALRSANKESARAEQAESENATLKMQMAGIINPLARCDCPVCEAVRALEKDNG